MPIARQGFFMRPCIAAALLLLAGTAIACKDYAQPERLRRFTASAQKQSQQKSQQNTPESKAQSASANSTLAPSPEANDTVPELTHRAIVRTSLGEITLGLYGKDAPQTVENFVRLAEKKFFRGILVHRIARDFVIQTGDPKTKDKRKKDEWGTGGESAFGEPFPDEISPEAPSVKQGYKRGTVAMATRSPDANTSQFFICLRDIPELPHKFTIFGEVLEGWEIVEKISAAQITPELNENDGRPVKAIVIKNVAVAKTRALTRK
ncbi:MAG: peptidylprolyl isomerase [Candidatus Kapabacteria bacterium]|nr:peptidylprolyl isomerase [Candidatus Kapabacteria bacterium]